MICTNDIKPHDGIVLIMCMYLADPTKLLLTLKVLVTTIDALGHF